MCALITKLELHSCVFIEFSLSINVKEQTGSFQQTNYFFTKQQRCLYSQHNTRYTKYRTVTRLRLSSSKSILARHSCTTKSSSPRSKIHLWSPKYRIILSYAKLMKDGSRSVVEVHHFPSRRCYNLINPLKPELNPICYLLALLRAHHFLHVSRIRVKLLTFRLLMS